VACKLDPPYPACYPAGLIAVNYPARAKGITRHMRVGSQLRSLFRMFGVFAAAQA
jgi:nucleotidyltransferase/DNA polymerase involved in DNA repair